MKNYLILIFSFWLANIQAQIWIDQSCPIEQQITSVDVSSANERDLLDIIINQEGKIMVNDKDLSYLSDVKFKEFIYTYITNPDENKLRSSSPKKAVIQINHYNHPEEYETYLTYIREVYYFIWNSAAQEKFEIVYNDLDCKQREKIQKSAPYRVYEFKNQKQIKNPNRPKFIGPPAFNGDVKDN